MSKTKYDFIKELLEDKKINQNHRERILELASREIRLEGALEERVQKIEEIIFKKENEENNSELFEPYELSNEEVSSFKENQKAEIFYKHSINEKNHNPRKVVEWLKLFTLHNSSLKYSTHFWDESGLFSEFDDFVKRLDEELVKYKIYELQKYNSNLYWNKLYPFLFQKELTSIEKEGKRKYGWGQHKIGIGWQYPEQIKFWCAEHFDHKVNERYLPFSMELPIDLRPTKPISGKTIVSFEDVVNLFKKEIEFRDNDLYFGVKALVKKELPDYDINLTELENLKGCSFYTNTEYVIKAINRIFWMIKSRSESNRVQITCNFKKDTHEYDFQIIHLNSFSDKELNHPKLLLIENSGDLYILRRTLQSLCDFSITSRFKDKNNNLINANIEYLYNGVQQNNWEPKIEKITESIDGFRFNMKFPVS
jgi:hypothetical protein